MSMMNDPSPQDRAPLRPWSPPRPASRRPGPRSSLLLGGLLLLLTLSTLLSAFPAGAPSAPSSLPVAGPTAAPLRFGPAAPASALAPAASTPASTHAAATAPASARPSGLLGLITVPGSADPTAMAYDPSLGHTILITPDPSGGAGATIETYSYSQGAWVPVPTATAPSSRQYEALTYDATIGRLVLFGGVDANGNFLSDTWEYSAAGWTNVTSGSVQSPSSRAGAHFAGDTAGGFDLLLGGYGPQVGLLSGNTNLTDSWEFQSGNWTPVAASTSGSVPIQGSMAYDAALGEVVEFGGATSGLLGLGCTSDTWGFSGGSWSRIGTGPAALAISSMAYDPATGGLFVFGGECALGLLGIKLSLTMSDTLYELANGSWSAVSVNGDAPSARYAADLDYDAASGTLLLFGGADSLVTSGNVLQTSLRAETYGLTGGTWTQIGPHLVSSHALVEVGEGFTLTVTGIVTPGAATFNYSGMPAHWNRSGPSADCVASAVGTLHPAVNITTALGIAASETAAVSANTTVPVLSRHWVSPLNVTRTLTEVGVPVTFSASLGGGDGTSTNSFVGLPGGCASANATSLSCNPSASGNFTVTFASTDALGISAAASVALRVAQRLSVSSLVMDHAAIDLGMSAVSRMDAAGGVGTVAITYPALPTGCAPANASTLTCTPSRSGAFQVSTQITDALGVNAQASVGLTVNPDPAIVHFALAGPMLSVGRSTSMTVTLDLTGGTGAYTVTYTGLPPGCAAPVNGVLDCRPSASGNFTVRVTATDALGWSAQTNLTVAVGPASTPGTSNPLGGTGVTGSSFSEGVLAALVLFGVVGAAVGVQRVARRRDGERLARELDDGIDSAGEGLGDEPTAPGQP